MHVLHSSVTLALNVVGFCVFRKLLPNSCRPENVGTTALSKGVEDRATVGSRTPGDDHIFPRKSGKK